MSVFLTARSPSGHVPDMSHISDEGLSDCRSGSGCCCHRSRPDPHRVVLVGQVEGVGAGDGGDWGCDGLLFMDACHDLYLRVVGVEPFFDQRETLKYRGTGSVTKG